jgi:hypothetical protein
VLALCAVILLTPRARADDVAAYLEQHGLNQLLAAHLEQQLASATNAPPEQREAIIKRLADIYAQLLERASDPAQRLTLEQRSRQLLEQAPERSADELRLALLRATYRTAEKIAEDDRLRLADSAELETARRSFNELVPELQSLRQQLRENVTQLERRLGRASGAESNSVQEAVDRARNTLAQCTFMTAWSLYYQDWLNDGPQSARDAETLFAELIGAESSAPRPEDVSVDLRNVEAVARSILGVALCKSITSSSATAIAWLALLTHPDTYEPLRTQVPIFEIAVYLEHKEYRDVIDVLNRARASMPEVPIAWLRLVAVHALEEKAEDRFAEDLARACVTELAARGELQQVLDLAQRYGIEALGDSGFALKYVQGVIKYQEARTRHGSEEPTLDPALGTLYGEAATALKAATTEPDAQKYAAPAAACKRLVAWCSFFRGNFLDATTEFEEAATALSGDEAAEALFMSIVSLDKVVQAGRAPEAQEQLNGLIERFLALYPTHPSAAQLVVKMSFKQEEPTPEAVAELLAVPPGSEAYDVAQSRAADMLYQLFRKAGANDRMVYAGQFLSVAVPLISQPPTQADASAAAKRQTFVVRSRQVLEVALTEGIERLVAARAAIDGLEIVRTVDPAAVEAHQDEIDCRKVQERLYAGDPQAAAALADGLWERDESSIWARLAVRSMFKQAHRVWKSDDSATVVEERDAAMERVVRYGGRVLYEFRDDPNALDKAGGMGYYAAVAEATFAQWQKSGDIERARAALFLFDKLLERRPNSAAFLRSAALLAEKVDQPQKALDHWRRIVAGSQVNSEAWYEAKFHQIQLLAKLDPVRARQVLDQHKQLNPDFGPAPWGPQIKGLDEQVPLNPAATPTTGPETQGEPQARATEGKQSVPRLCGAVGAQILVSATSPQSRANGDKRTIQIERPPTFARLTGDGASSRARRSHAPVSRGTGLPGADQQSKIQNPKSKIVPGCFA